MNPLALLAAASLAVPSVRAAGDCGPRGVDQLLSAESRRIEVLKKDAHEKIGDGAAVDPELDGDMAKAGPCLSEEQLAQFDKLRESHDLYCGWILSNSFGSHALPPVYKGNCTDDWAWLKPYRGKQEAEANQKWAAKIATPEGLLEEEKGRIENLTECAKASPGVIKSGEAADGVCAVAYAWLSPAEAKVGAGMSEQQLQDFGRLRAQYTETCRVIEGKVGAEAHRSSLCGADWSWLDQAVSAKSLRKGESRVLDLLKQAP